MLNPNPIAVRFLEGMSIKAGRSARVGSKDSFTNEVARNVIGQVHEDIAASIDVVKRLAKDESRTPPQQHHRGRQEAEALNAKLAGARDKLVAEAAKVEQAATAKIDEMLSLDPSRAFFHTLKVQWIIEQWKTPGDGLVAINQTVKSDPELAAVLSKTEPYLLKMPADAHVRFVEAGVKAHVPEAHAAIQTALAIRVTAAKYDGVMHDVRSSFAIDAVADKMNTRVED